jgi:hypothetical protein
MVNNQAYVGSPILMTHWDPDLYPARALPLIQELVIHILAYGAVLLKDVDLFLNPKIRAYLSDEKNFVPFSSLMDTGRIKVLIPDSSVKLDEDHRKYPISATAIERDKKRPLKSKPWTLTPEIRTYCAKLDGTFSHTGRSRRRRQPPPEKNEFADKLKEILRGKDRPWLTRRPFRAIDPCMAEQFAKFCEDPDNAIDFLRGKVTPNATAGFYRSLAYQCADRFEQRQGRAMKNLVQSVYTYCELNREDAAGTYYGNRITEVPLNDWVAAETDALFRIEVVPLPAALNIPVSANIGHIVSQVLDECDGSLRVFWGLVGDSPATVETQFRNAWAHIADAFAAHSSRAGEARTSKPVGLIEKATTKAAEGVGMAYLLNAVGELLGYKWLPDALCDLKVKTAITAVAVCSKSALEWIRSGRADVERKATRQILLDSATIRSGRVI